MVRHLLSIYDISEKEIWSLLVSAKKLKSSKKTCSNNYLTGKSLGMLFEKPSTRTSVSFSVGMHQLGGFPVVLDVKNMQINRGETLADTARVLSCYLDGIMYRAPKHTDIEEFSSLSKIPVINGLTDLEHPCQILGDLLTVIEKRKIKTLKELKKIKVVFVGDGNNVANSWIAAAAILGFDFALARPKGYDPDKNILKKAKEIAKKSGAEIVVTDNVKKAVDKADVIYTDVWTSMGEEKEEKARKKAFAPYQVNAKLLSLAKKQCVVMHCLPAIRGEEITSEVMDGLQSVVFPQAENRLHSQKAVLLYFLKNKLVK